MIHFGRSVQAELLAQKPGKRSHGFGLLANVSRVLGSSRNPQPTNHKGMKHLREADVRVPASTATVCGDAEHPPLMRPAVEVRLNTSEEYNTATEHSPNSD